MAKRMTQPKAIRIGGIEGTVNHDLRGDPSTLNEIRTFSISYPSTRKEKVQRGSFV
jgi:hypothetical protein